MSDATDDVDPERLQRQLAEIKGAMGLEDRYPGQRKLWLVYGVGVAVVSLLTEVLFVVEQLPSWGYFLVWLVFLALVGAAQWWLVSRTPTGPTPSSAPDWRVLFATLVLATVALSGLVQPLFPYLIDAESTETAGILQGAYFFGLVIAVAGVGFLFVGNALRAYHIRKRDRWVFYGAGVWMLVYASWFTHSEFLRLAGYAVFGILFLLYSIAAYVLLGRDPDGGGT